MSKIHLWKSTPVVLITTFLPLSTTELKSELTDELRGLDPATFAQNAGLEGRKGAAELPSAAFRISSAEITHLRTNASTSHAHPSRDIFSSLNSTEFKKHDLHKCKIYSTGSFGNLIGSNYWRNSGKVLLPFMFYRQQTLPQHAAVGVVQRGKAAGARSAYSTEMNDC